jgi:hypothetical protein
MTGISGSCLFAFISVPLAKEAEGLNKVSVNSVVVFF